MDTDSKLLFYWWVFFEWRFSIGCAWFLLSLSFC
jgi:hypothetical protein